MKYCPDCNTYLTKKKEDPENSTYARAYWCEWCKDYKDFDVEWKPSRKVARILTWTLIAIIALTVLKALF